MFLLVSVCHVAWRLHTNLYKFRENNSTDISYTKYSSDLNLGEGLCICTSFHFKDAGLYLLNGFDFSFDLFWMAWHWKLAIIPLYDPENEGNFWFSNTVKTRLFKGAVCTCEAWNRPWWFSVMYHSQLIIC